MQAYPFGNLYVLMGQVQYVGNYNQQHSPYLNTYFSWETNLEDAMANLANAMVEMENSHDYMATSHAQFVIKTRTTL